MLGPSRVGVLSACRLSRRSVEDEVICLRFPLGLTTKQPELKNIAPPSRAPSDAVPPHIPRFQTYFLSAECTAERTIRQSPSSWVPTSFWLPITDISLDKEEVMVWCQHTAENVVSNENDSTMDALTTTRPGCPRSRGCCQCIKCWSHISVSLRHSVLWKPNCLQHSIWTFEILLCTVVKQQSSLIR